MKAREQDAWGRGCLSDLHTEATAYADAGVPVMILKAGQEKAG
ncbi:hypothetical protein [Streptomyces sp. P10-4]